MRYQISSPARLRGWTLPRFLSLLLLFSGALLAAGVPLAGAPPPQGTLLGQPGVFRTFNPQLRQLEADIASRRKGPFTITLTQPELDAEVAWQLERLKGRLPVQEAFLQPGEGVLKAGGTLSLGPVAVPASIEVAVSAQGCDPIVSFRRITIGGSDTPEWVKARAEALVRQKLDEVLQRGLGFCLRGATFQPGQMVIEGSVEGN